MHDEKEKEAEEEHSITADEPGMVAYTVIPAHRRPRQQDFKVKAGFKRIERPCINK